MLAANQTQNNETSSPSSPSSSPSSTTNAFSSTTELSRDLSTDLTTYTIVTTNAMNTTVMTNATASVENKTYKTSTAASPPSNNDKTQKDNTESKKVEQKTASWILPFLLVLCFLSGIGACVYSVRHSLRDRLRTGINHLENRMGIQLGFARRERLDEESGEGQTDGTQTEPQTENRTGSGLQTVEEEKGSSHLKQERVEGRAEEGEEEEKEHKKEEDTSSASESGHKPEGEVEGPAVEQSAKEDVMFDETML